MDVRDLLTKPILTKAPFEDKEEMVKEKSQVLMEGDSHEIPGNTAPNMDDERPLEQCNQDPAQEKANIGICQQGSASIPTAIGASTSGNEQKKEEEEKIYQFVLLPLNDGLICRMEYIMVTRSEAAYCSEHCDCNLLNFSTSDSESLSSDTVQDHYHTSSSSLASSSTSPSLASSSPSTSSTSADGSVFQTCSDSSCCCAELYATPPEDSSEDTDIEEHVSLGTSQQEELDAHCVSVEKAWFEEFNDEKGTKESTINEVVLESNGAKCGDEVGIPVNDDEGGPPQDLELKDSGAEPLDKPIEVLFEAPQEGKFPELQLSPQSVGSDNLISEVVTETEPVMEEIVGPALPTLQLKRKRTRNSENSENMDPKKEVEDEFPKLAPSSSSVSKENNPEAEASVPLMNTSNQGSFRRVLRSKEQTDGTPKYSKKEAPDSSPKPSKTSNGSNYGYGCWKNYFSD